MTASHRHSSGSEGLSHSSDSELRLVIPMKASHRHISASEGLSHSSGTR